MMQDNKNGTNGHGPHKDKQDDDGKVIQLSDAKKHVDELRKKAEEAASQAAKEAKKQAKAEHPPLINLPPVTKILVLANIVIFLLTSYVLDSRVQNDLAFIPARYTGGMDAAFHSLALGPVTYMLLHGGWLHLLMNTGMLMAFGAGVERWMGGKPFLGFYVITGIIAALTHLLVFPSSEAMLVGASGGISGLFAAIILILQKTGNLPYSKYGVWPFVALWIGISLLFAFMNGITNFTGGEIAWTAHIGGFIAGFVLTRIYYFRV